MSGEIKQADTKDLAGAPEAVLFDRTQEWSVEVRAQILNVSPAPPASGSLSAPAVFGSGLLNPLKPIQKPDPGPVQTGDTVRVNASAYQASLRADQTTEGWGDLLNMRPPSGPIRVSAPSAPDNNREEEILPADKDDHDVPVARQEAVLWPSESHPAPLVSTRTIDFADGGAAVTKNKRHFFQRVLNYGIGLTAASIIGILGAYAITQPGGAPKAAAITDPQKKEKDPAKPPLFEGEKNERGEQIETSVPKQVSPEKVEEKIISPDALKADIGEISGLLTGLKNDPESLRHLNNKLDTLLRSLLPFVEVECVEDKCEYTPNQTLKDQSEAWKERKIRSALTTLKTDLWGNTTLSGFRGDNAEDKLSPEQKAIRDAEKSLRELINVINNKKPNR